MESVTEEAMGGNQDQSQTILKGKRTKRPRLQFPTLATSSSNGGDDQNNNNESNNSSSNFNYLQSPTTSAELSGSTTEEEEDMANCLILLAQGGGRDSPRFEDQEGGGERFVSRRFAETTTNTNGKAGFYVYECKTCNRCFPSFQALGGHRASHKKPKTVASVEEENPISSSLALQVGAKPISYNNAINSHINIHNSSNKSRVHECSICGSEFSSGQALGGHMRRHRATIAESQESNKKQKNILSLDLNLPAPQDDDRDFPKSPSSYSFAGRQPLVFSASPLVDCHY
ncbi:zinc finger protein ZAT5-like [Aristolochia californica]|uniref:zinc finger protein ZAT5-like n=1 Tax=Aristolochia californica TaxID=171875 RepID=UPI0035D784A3